MDWRDKVALVMGILTAVVFTVISVNIRETAWVWYQTRAFGLAAYAALFFTVIVGELRILTKGKAPLRMFKYHKPVAMYTIFLALTHGISAAADEFSWGKGVPWTSYLGFTFTNEFYVYLSLGTLAFYGMLLVALTSMRQSMQTLGFGWWKRIHYLSYVCFATVVVHALLLGHDLRDSALMPFLYPLFIGSVIVVTGLWFTRLVHGLLSFQDGWDIAVVGLFFLIGLTGTVLLVLQYNTIMTERAELERSLVAVEQNIDTLEDRYASAQRQVEATIASIDEVNASRKKIAIEQAQLGVS